ncbi:hypothetical protein SAMN05444359_1359 [Neolewinella agarilytica]|uniref:Uncharacterized protein n=1 Tax=Neolewinella agarilytica TaxID=478744 RepID=A0A1H9N9Y4_9BACT|nr:hypothetical protein SAMN05444359_1359 [Neolewinella agarilytica]
MQTYDNSRVSLLAGAAKDVLAAEDEPVFPLLFYLFLDLRLGAAIAFRVYLYLYPKPGEKVAETAGTSIFGYICTCTRKDAGDGAQVQRIG